jgi:hypothetical protein
LSGLRREILQEVVIPDPLSTELWSLESAEKCNIRKAEVIDMAVMELLPQLRQLSRGDKLYVMQFLVSELAAEQTDLIKPDLNYPVWSPYDAFEAANTMLQVLKATKSPMGDHDA